MRQAVPSKLRDFLLGRYAADLIAHNKYESLYRSLQTILSRDEYMEYATILSDILYEADINPLPYMSTVPSYFMVRSSLEEITIPDNIKEIGKFAFFGSDLKHIVIPDQCTSIRELAFAFCVHLEDAVLPATLVRVGEGAFKHTSLTHVIYGGTMRNWGNLTHPSDFLGETMFDLVISCSDGELVVSSEVGPDGTDVWAEK